MLVKRIPWENSGTSETLLTSEPNLSELYQPKRRRITTPPVSTGGLKKTRLSPFAYEAAKYWIYVCIAHHLRQGLAQNWWNELLRGMCYQNYSFNNQNTYPAVKLVVARTARSVRQNKHDVGDGLAVASTRFENVVVKSPKTLIQFGVTWIDELTYNLKIFMLTLLQNFKTKTIADTCMIAALNLWRGAGNSF